MTTPRARVEEARARFGRSEVVHRCNSLLAGGGADPEFVITLGGPAAVRYFEDGQPEHQEYWLRVWGVARSNGRALHPARSNRSTARLPT